MRLILILTLLVTISACSYLPSLDEVLPDKRTEYKKSEALPDLEVPPDLTAAAGTDTMTIPGETEATLSEYQQQKSGQTDTAAGTMERTVPNTRPVTGSEQPTEYAPSSPTISSEKWLIVTGTAYDIWPRLRSFLTDKGYTIDLDDPELGVLGTGWTNPVSEGATMYRNQFKIFSEPGEDPGSLILYVSNNREVQVSRNDEMQWIAGANNTEAESLLVGELNSYFNGIQQQYSTPQQTIAATGTREPAAIENVGEGNSFLNIPVEFTFAWRQVDIALQRAGIIVDNKDQSKGIYYITFFDADNDEKKGWASKLAFWKSEEEDGNTYQVSLVGVGNKTELIVLNGEGAWDNNDEANKILDMIRTQYNSL